MAHREVTVMLKKLEEFRVELKHRISFNQGQLEFAEDMIKQLRTAIDVMDQEERDLAELEEQRKKTRGIKTPKPREK